MDGSLEREKEISPEKKFLNSCYLVGGATLGIPLSCGWVFLWEGDLEETDKLAPGCLGYNDAKAEDVLCDKMPDWESCKNKQRN